MKINHGGHLIYQDTQIAGFTENKTRKWLAEVWQMCATDLKLKKIKS